MGAVLDRHGFRKPVSLLVPLSAAKNRRGRRWAWNVLFGALLLVVVGSLTGEWLSIENKLTDTVSFYLGHQGYEYVDLGRVWQIALMVRTVALAVSDDPCVASGFAKDGRGEGNWSHSWRWPPDGALFYGAGLTWGRHTHLSMVENTGDGGSFTCGWKGSSRVFATTVIAFIFMRLNLIRRASPQPQPCCRQRSFFLAASSAPAHHLYFSGTPTVALVWGSVFSALEVVPLVLVGFDATEDLWRSRTSPWVQRYKWPIYFFVSVAFWNMIGAGLFGFMINPPIALYYMRDSTRRRSTVMPPCSACMGCWGIGLMLICLRVLIPGREMEGWSATVLAGH